MLPSSPANSLDGAQCRAVYDAMLRVCREACACNADSAQFPPTWLFHHRWANQTSGSISSPLGRIHFDTVGGRTTAYLPSKQRAGAAARLPLASKAKAPATKAKKSKRASETEGADVEGPAVEVATAKSEEAGTVSAAPTKRRRSTRSG